MAERDPSARDDWLESDTVRSREDEPTAVDRASPVVKEEPTGGALFEGLGQAVRPQRRSRKEPRAMPSRALLSGPHSGSQAGAVRPP